MLVRVGWEIQDFERQLMKERDEGGVHFAKPFPVALAKYGQTLYALSQEFARFGIGESAP